MSVMNPQAKELNDSIVRENPHVFEMLSHRGRGIFFPKKGILGQSAEAKGKEINATIGIALEEDGSPVRLSVIEELIRVDPADVFPYAPSFGRPDIRATWRSMIYKKNPSLGETPIGTPVVTCALTHGLSMCGYLFGNDGDAMLIPDLYWGNYRLIFANTFGVQLVTFPTFSGSGFNVSAMREAIFSRPRGKCLISLNFPNNPTGYTPTESEGKAITAVLTEAAAAGYSVVVLIDDAYFGLVFEDGIMKESLFPALSQAHERLLAVKIDGATKEDYVWGLRVGFVTFGIKGGTTALYQALESKLAGAVRGTISNSSNLSQSLLARCYQSKAYDTDKQAKFSLLQRRYEKVKDILRSHPEYRDAFTALPFNSGYFMCLRPVKADPERVRQLLLAEYATGIIAVDGLMRVAFSSTPLRLLERLFHNIYEATKRIAEQ